MSMVLTQCPDCGQITLYNAAAIGQQLGNCPAGHSFIADFHRIANDIVPHGRKVAPAYCGPE